MSDVEGLAPHTLWTSAQPMYQMTLTIPAVMAMARNAIVEDWRSLERDSTMPTNRNIDGRMTPTTSSGPVMT